MISIYSTLQETARLFSEVVILCIPTSKARELCFTSLSLDTVTSCCLVLMLTILTELQRYFNAVAVCPSPMVNDAAHPSVCLLSPVWNERKRSSSCTTGQRTALTWQWNGRHTRSNLLAVFSIEIFTEIFSLELKYRDLPGCPAVKTRACQAGRAGSIPGRGTKSPHVTWSKNRTV